MKHRRRLKILPTVVAIVIVVALFVFGILLGKGMFSSEPEITAQTISNAVSEITQYAVLEYRYTNVGKFEDQVDFYGWKVPLTTKSFILTYDGSMKLGVDGKADVSVEGNKVKIALPPITVLSHEIYEDSLEVMDQSKNVFNPILIEDYATFATDSKEEVQEKATNSGMFQEAEEIAKTRVSGIINSLQNANEQYSVEVTVG